MNSDSPRVAVEALNELTKYGFLLSDDGAGTVTVRFLNPVGFTDVEVPRGKLRGTVGKDFFASRPHRPDVCDTVIFFDHGRQRKGWVEDVPPDGKVIMGLGMKNILERRWREEIILLRVGEGFRTIIEEEELDALLTKEREELRKIGTILGAEDAPVCFVDDSSSARRHGAHINERESARQQEDTDQDQTALVEQTRSVVEKLRAVSARFKNSNKGA